MTAVREKTWSRIRYEARGGRIVVITGAGVSADSGIPTFRSKNGTGLYESAAETYGNIVHLLNSMTLELHPEHIWKFYLDEMRPVLRNAEPNAAHLAIARLEAFAGDRFTLITQNVDGLHLRAGNTHARTIELHGDDRMRCARECWLAKNGGIPEFWAIPDDAQSEMPRCPRCKGPARPHTLLFDETYSQELYRSRDAHRAAQGATLILTVGCSATVPVAAILANYSEVTGALVVDVNPDESPLSDLARSRGVWLKGRAADEVPSLVDFLLSTGDEQWPTTR